MEIKKILPTRLPYVARSTYNPKIFSHGSFGSWVKIYDQTQGQVRELLDFTSGPGAANIGWNHPKLIEAVREFLADNSQSYGGNDILNEQWLKLAEKLAKITPGDQPKVVFPSNSGTEAVEAGIIAAFSRRPERKGLVTFLGDFHGRTGFARAATSSKSIHVERIPQALDVHRLMFPAMNPDSFVQEKLTDLFSDPHRYIAYVDAHLGNFIRDINLAVIELVQGEGGINWPYPDTLRALVHYLQDWGIWVLVDEVQTGFGRTGKMFACENFYICQRFEIKPDILTLAKAAGGGLIPCGYTILRKELDYDDKYRHSNTFGGNPLAAFVTLTILEIIEEERLVELAGRMGTYLADQLYIGLRDLIKEHRVQISGMGLMQRLRLNDQQTRDWVCDEAFKRGLFLMGAGTRSIRLMPPLTVNHVEIDIAVATLSKVFKEVFK